MHLRSLVLAWTGRGPRFLPARGLPLVCVLFASACAQAAPALALPGATLPDGRGWEMVSPPLKSGVLIEAITDEGGVIEASESGDALTYVANGPILPKPEATPEGNRSKELTQVFSARTAAGWSTQDIATPHDSATGLIPGNGSEYRFFSPDLSVALVEPEGEEPLSPEATERTIYLRERLREAGAPPAYRPLVTASNTGGAKFGGQGFRNDVRFLDATPDLSHVLFESTQPLTANAVTNTSGNIYEVAGGRIQLVSLLPGGEPAPEPVLGNGNGFYPNAVSTDGSRVIWSDEQHLYLRDTTTASTVRIDAAQEAPEPETAEAQFQGASSDGSLIFFTDDQRLTPDSTALTEAEGAPEPEADLYEFNADTGKLTDLTVDHNAGESAAVQGHLLGASEDGSYVYFVATGVLSAEENSENAKPLAGEDNLYLYEPDPANPGAHRIAFIATLSSEDGHDWNAPVIGSAADLGQLTARVSPNGSFVAFMSDRSLTHYDNTDVNSGRADEEVFLYDAATDRLVCASCNPSGARPAGVFDSGEFPGLLVDRRENWTGRWLAASIPGWTNVDLVHALYQSRYLSNTGRLFFNSADALVPQDVNGKEDVYEYEPEAVGTCTNASATLAPASNGCIALISAGSSSEESAFLDASSSGDDVFFLTASQLAPQDNDTALDVYDAHVCTQAEPCPAPPAASPQPCSSAAACRAPAPTQTIGGAVASATLSGTGNLAPPAAVAAVQPKRPTAAQMLSRALKACRRKPPHKRRSCEAQARRRYRQRSHASGDRTRAASKGRVR